MNLIRKLALTAVLTAAATTTSTAANLNWGTGGLSNNWSDTNNWYVVSAFPRTASVWTSPPGANDVVYFEDLLYSAGFPPGWTNAPGAVNNIVDTDFAVGVLPGMPKD